MSILNKKHSFLVLFAILISISLLFTACGSDNDVISSKSGKNSSKKQNIVAVDGENVISGSSSSDSANSSSFGDATDGNSSKKESSSSKVPASSSNPNNSKPDWVDKTPSGSIDMSLLTKPNVGDKVCYLTFDDGPSENTLKILNILNQANAKATFFVISTSNLDYIKKADEAGHAIGLHANSHEYGAIYKSEDAYFNDLATISNKVKNLIGKESKLLRFPGGSSNTASRKYKKGIMSTLTKAVEAKGYAYFDWNVDSGDASGNNIAVSKLVNNIKNSTSGTRDICVLMHDTAAKDTTVEALPQIICYLRGLGYRFEALTTDSPVFHHGVNN